MFMILNNDVYINYTNNTLYIQKSISKISEVLLKNNVNMKLQNILIYVRRLKFSQSPNYEYIKSLII